MRLMAAWHKKKLLRDENKKKNKKKKLLIDVETKNEKWGVSV